MKVRIYQIDFERDEKFLCYRNLETVLERCGGIIPAESYNMVFEYEALSDNLERLFFIFNDDRKATVIFVDISVLTVIFI